MSQKQKTVMGQNTVKRWAVSLFVGAAISAFIVYCSYVTAPKEAHITSVTVFTALNLLVWVTVACLCILAVSVTVFLIWYIVIRTLPSGDPAVPSVDPEPLPSSTVTSSLQVIEDHVTPQIKAPAPTVPPQFDLLQLQNRWRPRKGRLLLAYSNTGPVTLNTRDAWHIALAAATGAGKTNIFRLLMLQMAPFEQCYFISPNYAPLKRPDAPGEEPIDWRPIAKYLKGIATQPDEIESLLQWAVGRIKERQQMERNGNFNWRPVFIFIDEWPLVVSMCGPAIKSLCATIVRVGRQYDVTLNIAAQDFLKETSDLSVGELSNYRTVFYLGTDSVTARKLLRVGAEDPGLSLNFTKGVTLIKANGITPYVAARVPHVTNRSLYAYYNLPFDPEQYRNTVQISNVTHQLPASVTPVTLNETDADKVINAAKELQQNGKRVTKSGVAQKIGWNQRRFDEIVTILEESGIEYTRKTSNTDDQK